MEHTLAHIASAKKVGKVGKMGPFWKRQTEAIQGVGLHSQAMILEPEIIRLKVEFKS